MLKLLSLVAAIYSVSAGGISCGYGGFSSADSPSLNDTAIAAFGVCYNEKSYGVETSYQVDCNDDEDGVIISYYGDADCKSADLNRTEEADLVGGPKYYACSGLRCMQVTTYSKMNDTDAVCSNHENWDYMTEYYPIGYCFNFPDGMRYSGETSCPSKTTGEFFLYVGQDCNQSSFYNDTWVGGECNQDDSEYYDVKCGASSLTTLVAMLVGLAFVFTV